MLIESLEQTQVIAHSVANVMKENDVIILNGDVGAGKTTFAKFLIKKLCEDESLEVTSPTFSIVQIYSSTIGSIWHVDLYRLKDPEEIFETGIYDMLGKEVCIIEWPEKIMKYLPSSYLNINLDQETKKITLEKHGDWCARDFK